MNRCSRKPVGPRGGACTAGVTGVDFSPRSTGVCQSGTDARRFARGMRTTTMRRLIARLAIVAMVAFATVDQAHSAVMSEWSLNNTTNGGLLPGGTNNFGPSPFNPTLKDSNVTVGGLTRGTGVGTTGTGAASGWGGNAWDGNASFAAAVTANDFVTFTVKADAGFELSLTDIAAYNVRRSSSGHTTGQWQYSTDGTTFADIGSAITWGGTTSGSGNSQSAISLSGISALQNVPDTTTVTFRVVNWSASSSGGTWYLNGAGTTTAEQFLIVNGTTAVPEPSTLGFAGLGVALAGLGAWKRRAAAVVLGRI